MYEIGAVVVQVTMRVLVANPTVWCLVVVHMATELVQVVVEATVSSVVESEGMMRLASECSRRR